MTTLVVARMIATALKCVDCGVEWHGVGPCWVCGQPGERHGRNTAAWAPNAMKGTPSRVDPVERFVL